jgi:hypothetical protein
MNAFAAADAALFRDPNLSVEVAWQAGGEGPTTPIRVILTEPDGVEGFDGTQILTDSMIATVRIADLSAPQGGDYVQVGGDWYVVDGEPQRDVHRLTWRVTLVPEARA